MPTLFKNLVHAARIHVKGRSDAVLEFTFPMPQPNSHGVCKRHGSVIARSFRLSSDGDYWIYADGVIVADDKPHEESDHDLFALYGGILIDEKFMRKNRLFFQGRARYADVFRNKYVIGFCFVFDPIGEKFVRWGDKEYNYTRKE